ncbi:alpha/beta hydrolase [Streptomyces sp. NPDC048664]|uniref:alpha/beta hydrolase n=1 Tax=Streptomyces sp. NPDC048664 TaxID=3154505 RepID=UPI003416579C
MGLRGRHPVARAAAAATDRGAGAATAGGTAAKGAVPREGTRRRRGRLRRTGLTALLAAAVVIPLSAGVRPPIPAPPPARLAPLSVATIAAIYDANRADAATASRMADGHGDRHRAAVERAMASPDRHLLAFDGRGTGRVAEVFGDLATAEHIAVLVPGSDTTLDSYGRLGAGAGALYRAAGPHTAVIAWLGYDTPRMISPSALTTTRAEEAAPLLRRFVRQLRGARGERPGISLLCHSYGTVVCAKAAGAADVQDVVLLGSPGTGVDRAAGLRTRARVWAGRGAGDWIAHVPHVSADLFGTTTGFGADPVSPGYGARVFAAGGGGHSDYFRPGSLCLRNLARITQGRAPEAPRA